MRKLSTKDMLVAGMIALVFALVQIGAIYAFMAVASTAGPAYARLLNGFWFIPGFMAMAIIRKPGIGFIAQVIAGIIMVPLSPYGVMMLFGTLVTGLLTELIFLITRYKNFSAWLMVPGMALLSVLYTLVEYGPSGYGGLSVGVQLGILLASIGSGAVCGWISKRITESLLKSGLLSGYRAVRS